MSIISNIGLLSIDETTLAHEIILGLRDVWIERQGPFFYSIGAAGWLDINASGSISTYRRMVTEYNPILSREFSWLYTKLLDGLTHYLGQPVTMMPNYGLPGFHIFLSHPQLASSDKDMLMQEWYLTKLLNPRLASSPIHYDDFSYTGLKGAEDNISFTLSIRLPSTVSGLNVWSLSKKDVAGLPIAKERAAVLSSPKTFYPYSLGSLFVHTGDLYHQAVVMTNYNEGESRITMQGHALLYDGVWYAYW